MVDCSRRARSATSYIYIYMLVLREGWLQVNVSCHIVSLASGLAGVRRRLQLVPKHLIKQVVAVGVGWGSALGGAWTCTGGRTWSVGVDPFVNNPEITRLLGRPLGLLLCIAVGSLASEIAPGSTELQKFNAASMYVHIYICSIYECMQTDTQNTYTWTFQCSWWTSGRIFSIYDRLWAIPVP